MTRYEYRVVPAPVQGRKAKGVKGTAGRFAHALQTLMNEMGAEGWDYVRADTLPCEERTGLTGRTTTYQNLLVFRRPLAPEEDHDAPAVSGLLAAPLPEHRAAGAEAPPAPPGVDGDHRAPPLTRAAPAAVARGAATGPRETSAAARAAAAALRTYRAGSAGDATSGLGERDDDAGKGHRGGGLAAE